MAVTVGISDQAGAIALPCQRKCFYAGGRHWDFWAHKTSDFMYFSSSANGIAWDAPTSVGVVVFRGYTFSVWTDGTYVYYARACSGAGVDRGPLYFRRGLLNSPAAGQIAWDAEVVVDNYATCLAPMISRDSNGLLWIVWTRLGETNVYAIQSQNIAGTLWNVKVNIKACASGDRAVQAIVPLSGGKMFACWAQRNVNIVKGKLWNGAIWGGEEVIGTLMTNYEPWSATSNFDDEVYVVWTDNSNVIKFRERNGAWGGTTTLSSEAELVYPAISWVDGSTCLYVFWTRQTNDHVYYIPRTDTTWQAIVDWIDESVDELPVDHISSFFKSYSNYVGVTYTNKLIADFNIRYDFLDLNVADPTNIAASCTLLVAPYQITVTWNDNATNETSYTVQRDDGGWHTIATLPAGSTSYIDNAMVCNTNYLYRVRASSDCINSNWLTLGAAVACTCFVPPTPEPEPEVEVKQQLQMLSKNGFMNMTLDMNLQK